LSVLFEIYDGAEETVEHQAWSFVSSRIDVFRDISTLKLPTYHISMKHGYISVAGARTNLSVCNKALSFIHTHHYRIQHVQKITERKR